MREAVAVDLDLGYGDWHHACQENTSSLLPFGCFHSMMVKRAQPIPYKKRSGKQPMHLGLVPTETLTFGRMKYSHNEVHSIVNGVLLFIVVL